MDSNQTTPVGMLVSMLMLNRHFPMLAFKGLNNAFCVYTEVMVQDDTVTFE